jgi:hypothetical protein
MEDIFQSNAWAFKYNLIRDLTGINPARDGSLSQDALLGVNQMSDLASNTVTAYSRYRSNDE